MISKQFIKSTFIYSVVGALPLASGLILLLFYANLLSKELIGVFALYVAFTILVQTLVSFAMESHIGYFYIENKNNTPYLKKYIGTMVTAFLLISIVYIVISICFGNVLFRLVFQDTFYPFGFMCVFTGIFNAFFKTYTALLISQQRPVRFFWYNLINFILTIVVSVIVLYMYPKTLMGPMWGRLLSGVGIFVISLWGFIKEFGIYFIKEYLKPIFLFCFPIFIYYLLTWVLSNIDRFIINEYLTKSDIAIYDIALKSTLLIEYVQMGIVNSFYPKIFNIWNEQQLTRLTPEVNRYFNGYTAVTMLILPVFVIIIPLIVPIIITKNDYSPIFPFLSLLSLGFITRSLFGLFSAPIYYLKKTKLLPPVFLFSAICQVILSVVLIKYFGLWGAVWAGLIVKVLQVLFLYIITRKIFTYTFNRIKQLYLPLSYILLIVFSEAVMIEKYRFLIHVIQLFIAFTLVFWVYRKELTILVHPILVKFKKRK
ncbi:MAG: polysaccharide biosynthesis C-terminal domain-containing protein [Bacteroidales bacterium]